MSSEAGSAAGADERAADVVSPPDADAGAVDEVADDALAALRAELESVDDVPIRDRVELFERTNETLAAELAALDEV